MDDYRFRFGFSVGLILMMVGLMTGRLVQLQLVETAVHSDESMRTTVSTKRVQPARGLFFDRSGLLLVDNEPTYSLSVIPRFFEDDRIPLLASLLGVEDSVVANRIKEARAWSRYRATRIFREVPFEVFSSVQENLYRLPGIEFIVDERRRYHQGVNASHVYGYINEISQAQLEPRRGEGYQMGDRLGQTGVENTYEYYLRGKEGAHLVLVNIRGQEVKSYREGAEDVQPSSGYDLVLTIDAGLQALTEELMMHKRGAAVALDPRNGEILAMVSAPDYDPTYLSGMVDPAVWSGLQSDHHVPLFNRVMLSRQPPGSTFKPFMAMTTLQDGVITEDTPITCNGGYTFGRFFRCMGAHGTLTVKDAIKRSCNTFFYTIMMRQDFDRWSQWGKRFGFGVTMPTDLPEQIPGIFPDSSYFDRRYGKGRWTRGFLVSLGIGQGDMGVTPMQLVRYVSVPANGGYLVSPHVVREMVHPETGERIIPGMPPPERLPIEDRHIQAVREGMRRMVMENNSTVKWGDVMVAGKTGTAQNPHGKDHAWFMGFAPFENPQIAVAVLVENAGFGASVSAPIAGLMLEQYLTGGTTQHPEWVHSMARNTRSADMADGSGVIWHRAPGRTDVPDPTAEPGPRRGQIVAAAGGR